jgi:hypothetical protein
MDTIKLAQNQTVFHPSIFESVQKDIPGDKRTLLSVRKQRGQRLNDADLQKLQSPGRYAVTSDDSLVSSVNTGYLFKNLYGNTLLTDLFFSEQNISNIQNLIRLLVHKETNYIIDNQSVTELLVIMRSIFLEYHAHPPLINNTMSNQQKQELYKKYTNEVSRLNEIVLNQVVPKVVSQLQQYLDYLRDASQQPYQIETPKFESITGERQYRSVTQVLLGGDL